jgi:hypothetical protein
MDARLATVLAIVFDKAFDLSDLVFPVRVRFISYSPDSEPSKHMPCIWQKSRYAPHIAREMEYLLRSLAYGQFV